MQDYIITYLSTLVNEWFTIDYSGSRDELDTFLKWLKPVASNVTVSVKKRHAAKKSYHDEYGCEDFEVSIGEIKNQI
jgi:hypothetical protein